MNWRPYSNYANYRDGQIELIGGHIGIMLIIEMAKIELPGGHIGFTLNLEITKIELTDGHIGFFS